MKKLFVFVLVLALLAVPAVHAEDYASMTDDELWAANKAIQAELWARSIAKDGVTVPTGVYNIGEDIPAGIYRIVIAPDCIISMITMNYYNEKYEMDDSDLFSLTTNQPEIGKIDLSKYTSIEISGPVVFMAYTGLFN